MVWEYPFVPPAVQDALTAKNVPTAFGEFLFGYVKDDYRRPNPETAIQVTANWTGKTDGESHLDELEHWWQQVGTDAHSSFESPRSRRRPIAARWASSCDRCKAADPRPISTE